MPTTPETPVSLEDLLRLKRFERPDPSFWDKFDRDLERRRLQALMKDEDPAGRTLTWSWGAWRQMVCGTGLSALILGIAFVGIQRFQAVPPVVAESAPGAKGQTDGLQAMILPREGETVHAGYAAVAGPGGDTVAAAQSSVFRTAASAQFVVDVLSTRVEEDHFERVHANPALFGSVRSDAHFVADPLTVGGRARATFLLDRPPGQF